MEFELSPEQREIQAVAREFADAEIAPHAATWDREHRFPHELVPKLAELGLMGVSIPEELGGAGADFVSYMLVLEEISRADAGIGVTVAVHSSAATVPIVLFGTEEQRQELVPPLARGEKIGAFALTESDSGSDARSLRTKAEADGDGWRLTGTKQWITSGSFGGTILVFARGENGISCFLVDGTPEGFGVTKEHSKLGLHSSSTVDLVFDGVEVPADRLLGEDGKGFNIAMATLDGGRIGIAAQAVGIAQAAFDAARAYALERKQFGKRIAEFGAIQGKLADMATEIDAARLLVLPRRVAARPGPPARRGRREGEALRLERRAAPDRRGDPDPRRLRLHHGVPGRALLPRREDHGDLRGDERDPAARDRPLRARSRRARRTRRSAGVSRKRDEPVRLDRIYTRGGDAGQTSLGDGQRVSKADLRVEAYGAVDELNALLGVVLAREAPAEFRPWLERIQNELFDLGADLAVPLDDTKRERTRITEEQVERLENLCDEVNDRLAPLRSFVLPGGTEPAALLHLARTVCRRAERVAVALAAQEDVSPEALAYLNRLSDLLFILARAANAGHDEPLWKPGTGSSD